MTTTKGGYVVDKNIGNTGGLGGVFGMLHAVDKGFGFPEAKPWRPSFRLRLFTFLGALINMLPRVEDFSRSAPITKEVDVLSTESKSGTFSKSMVAH